MQAIVFDTETTGIKNAEIIEAAWSEAHFAPELEDLNYITLQFGDSIVERFKPEGKISMGAMATHHIQEEDLADCPPSSSFTLPHDLEYMIGHNVDFDWAMAGSPPNVKRIDTLCLARKFFPECDAYSLGALTYYLFPKTARDSLRSAHSAGTDIELTINLLMEILERANCEIRNFEQLWQLSESARVPSIMPFGKHKGLPIDQVPSDYKAWLLGQADVDPYLQLALRKKKPQTRTNEAVAT
jgi:exodeoxyribonuclease X